MGKQDIQESFINNKTQDWNKVFSNFHIKRIVDIKMRTFSNKAILYADYTVERENRQQTWGI